MPINEITIHPTSQLVKSSSVVKNHDSIAETFILSFMAASCSEFVTYPLDLTKARLQIQGEVAMEKFNGEKVTSLQKRGMFRTMYGIVHEEGFFKLWQGMSPAIYRHLVYSGVRMSFYEYLRDDLLGKNEDNTITLWKAIIGGVCAGGFAQFLASPFDLVKIQLQMEGRRKLQGLPPRVTGSWDAVRKIVAQGGLKGLMKGWGPNVQRAAFVNLGDLTTYDSAKHMILKHTSLKDDYFVHALGSCCSGLIAACLGTPADVIKTRVMNQPTDPAGNGVLYKNSIDCLMQSVRKEGFWSLYKGFIPCWLRMGPWSLTFWITYEELRKYTGHSSF
ncbi:Mitochondrial uncoupling protein 4 [Halotydeus destructor]|nr:Mitochondrial uncoupling protein 4 [Halotydeus destructor]